MELQTPASAFDQFFAPAIRKAVSSPGSSCRRRSANDRRRYGSSRPMMIFSFFLSTGISFGSRKSSTLIVHDKPVNVDIYSIYYSCLKSRHLDSNGKSGKVPRLAKGHYFSDSLRSLVFSLRIFSLGMLGYRGSLPLVIQHRQTIS